MVKIDNNGDPMVQIFMPVNMPSAVLSNKASMKYIKSSFDTSDLILCYCGKCVRMFLLLNKYTEVMRFTRAFVTKISKNITKEKHRAELIGHYMVISTKEGIIKDMLLNNGQLSLTCPVCLMGYFEDHYSAMHDLGKNVLNTNNDTGFIMTSELIEAALRLINDVYVPLFRGYTSPESLRNNIAGTDNKQAEGSIR